MSYVGEVRNGVVVLEEGTGLAEGTRVRVEPLEQPPQPTLAQTIKPWVGILEGMPPDLALNHDHYLHGQPKK